jgi:hypothetical protein
MSLLTFVGITALGVVRKVANVSAIERKIHNPRADDATAEAEARGVSVELCFCPIAPAGGGRPRLVVLVPGTPLNQATR